MSYLDFWRSLRDKRKLELQAFYDEVSASGRVWTPLDHLYEFNLKQVIHMLDLWILASEWVHK